MSLLNILKRKLKKENKAPSLKKIIHKQTGCSYRNIYISDRHIDLCTDEEIDEFLTLDKTDELPWKIEIFDCDDVSRVFFNNAKLWFYNKKNINAAIGWIWAGGHAFNFYVRKSDLKVIGLEPQRDERVSITSRPVLIII